MSTRLQNIIFDIGGVLLEWQPLTILEQFTEDEILKKSIYQLMFKHFDWQQWDRGVITMSELMTRAAERLNLPLREIECLMELVKDSLHLKPDTLNLLDELRDERYTLFCLSNMPREHYDTLSKVHDFWERFDGVVISALVGSIKPEQGIFQYLLQRYHLKAESCILVDDQIENIKAAAQLGIAGILFNSAEDCRRNIYQLSSE